MDISERINRHEQKKKAENTPAVSSQATKPDPTKPVEKRFPSESVSQATQAMTSTDAIDADKVELRPKVDWRSLDYDSAVKFNPNLSRSQYISGAAAYRKENDKPGFTDDELYTLLGGKDPFISAEQEQKNERRMKAAGYVDAIGGVLANLVNYIRTTRGNPAMNLSSLSQNTARLDKLKAYHDALGRQNFGVYMDMLEKQRAREAAAEQAENKFRQQMALLDNKYNSPLYKSQLLTEEARRKGIMVNNELTGHKVEYQKKVNEALPEKLNAEIAHKKELAAAAGRRNRDSSSGGKSGKEKKKPFKAILRIGNAYSREYDLNNDDDVLEMYWNGVKWNLPEYLEHGKNQNKYNLKGKSQEAILDLKDIDKIRNVLKYNRQYYITPEDKDYYKYVKINDYPEFLSPESSNDDNNNNNDLDYQIYE